MNVFDVKYKTSGEYNVSHTESFLTEGDARDAGQAFTEWLGRNKAGVTAVVESITHLTTTAFDKKR